MNGWLSKDGIFTECDFMQHDKVAWEQFHLTEHGMYREGFVKIMKNYENALNAGCMINNYMPVTLKELIANNKAYFSGNKRQSDTINRNDAIDAFGHGTTYTSNEIIAILKKLPPVK